MEERRKLYLDLLLIILLGLLSLTWFRGEFLVNPGDTNFSFNPPHDLYRTFFVWDHQQGLGRIDSMASAKIFPYNLLLSLLTFLGVSIYGCQKILFYLIFTLSGLSAYFLVKYLLSSKPYGRIGALLGANFYMMNAYLIQLRWGSGYLMALFFYAVLPLLIFIWLKGRRRKDFRFSVYFSLVFLLGLPSLSNAAYVMPLVVICGLDLAIQLFINLGNKGKFVSLLRFSCVTLLVFAFFFFFWVISQWIPFEENLANLHKSSLQFNQAETTSSKSSILNLFRNLGDWGFWGSYSGEKYYPYSPIYNSFLFILIGLIIPLFSLSPLLFLKKQNDKKKYHLLFFTLVFLIGIWLTKGVHNPFGNIYRWALRNIPVFGTLRFAHDKFGPVMIIGTTVLLGHSLVFFLQGIKRKWGKVILTLLLFSLINIYAWPFWTGDTWKPQGKVLPGTRFQIPNYYYDLKMYLDKPNHQSYKILQLPDNAALVPGIVSLNLNGKIYVGSDPLGRMLKRPIIYLNPFSFERSENMAGIYFQHYSTNLTSFVSKINNLSKILNIKIVLLRGDSDNTTYQNIINPKKIKPLLNSFELEKSFGKLDLYKISDEYFLSHIYASATPILVDGDVEALISLAVTEYLDGKPALFFNTQKENQGLEKRKDISKLVFSQDKWEILETAPSRQTTGQEPEITFKKINPTKYLVKVEKAKEPFWLVFSESFHKKWRAYVNPRVPSSRFPVTSKEERMDEIVAEYPKLGVKEAKHLQKFTPRDIEYLFRKEDIKNHYLVNGYANAWYIDPEELRLGKDFVVTLYFWPQSLFYLGLGISGLTFIGCIGYLGFDFTKRKFKYAKGNQGNQNFN